jgi:hypothetical protein
MTHQNDLGVGVGTREQIGEITENTVVAIRNEDDTNVYLYGYGQHAGEEPPPGWFIPVPKIILNDGEVIWGYQCWWTPARGPDRVRRLFPGKKVVFVPLPEEDE